MRLCFWQGFYKSDLIQLPPVGMPYLVDENGHEVEAPNAYLLYVAQHKGRTRSPRTWATYGYHLYDFFGFLEANQMHWDQPQKVGKPSVVAPYREWALARRKPGSVNDYLGTIERFYTWGLRHRMIQEAPWDIEEVVVGTKGNFLAHIGTSARSRTSSDIKLREFEQPVEVLQVEEAARLLKALRNGTHHLMTRLVLATGLRVSELLTFPAHYVFNPSGRAAQHISVDLDPREMTIKYNKPRWISISQRLMRHLWEYAMIGRTPRWRAANARGENPSALFLTEGGHQFHLKTYNKILRTTGQRIGRHVTPHLLRHTYATHTLHALTEQHNSGFALKWVKDRLGHASVNTTMRYLHLIGELHVKELDAYQQELDSVMEPVSHYAP